MMFAMLLIFKIVELLIALICVGIHDCSYNQEKAIGMLVTGTFIGFSIIFAGLILAYLVGNPVEKPVDMFYTIAGAILFCASGALLLHRYSNIFNSWGVISEYRDKNLAKASLAIINAAILVADAILTFLSGPRSVFFEIKAVKNKQTRI